jgi:hypothetical protein
MIINLKEPKRTPKANEVKIKKSWCLWPVRFDFTVYWLEKVELKYQWLISDPEDEYDSSKDEWVLMGVFPYL